MRTHSRQGSESRPDEGPGQKSIESEGGSGDLDVEGDMILGDLEPETSLAKSSSLGSSSSSKSNPATTSYRPDIDEIVTGSCNHTSTV